MSEFIFICIALYIGYRMIYKRKPRKAKKPTIRQATTSPRYRPRKPKLDASPALHLNERQETIAMIQDRLWDLDTGNPMEFHMIKKEILEDVKELQP